MNAANDNFGNLPAELQHRTFEFLPSHSLKIARLVSRAWSLVAAAVLFQTAKLDLIDLRGRNLDAIIDGPANGFLVNIRNLTIAASKRKPTAREAISFSFNFLVLISALPRDSLVLFTSGILGREAIGILLRTQSRLRVLKIGLKTIPGPQSRDGLPGLSYVRGNLSALRSLELVLGGTHSNPYDCLGTWFAHSSSLTTLTLIGSYLPPQHHFKGWTLLSDTPLLKLRCLRLRNIAFSTLISMESLPKQLHLPSLKELYIQGCSNTNILLEAFTAAYMSFEHNNLEILEHKSMLRTDDMAAISFLGSLKNPGAVIRRSDAASEYLPGLNHSLQFLHIGISSTRNPYNGSELDGLCKTCPNLQVICLDLVNLGELLGKYMFRDPQPALRDTLQALARFRFLRTLCITNRPLADRNPDINDRHSRYWLMANIIFSCLDWNSSPIRMLVFNPAHSYALPGDVAVDVNGHTWPFYAYQKVVRMTVSERAHCGLAEPVKREQIHLFEPYHGHLCRSQMGM